MKKQWLFATSVMLGAAIAAAPLDRELRLNFETGVQFSVYPAAAKSAVTLNSTTATGGKNALQIQSDGANPVTVYAWFPGNMYSMLRGTPPGTVRMSLNHRTLAGNTSISGALQFFDATRRLGSAGRAKFTLPAATTWQHVEAVYDFPENAIGFQFALGPDSHPGTVLLDDVRLRFIPDTVTLPRLKSTMNLAAPLSDSRWNPEAPQFGFYNQTKPAQNSTELRTAANDDALFFAFECTESDMANLQAKIPADRVDPEVWHDDCVTVFLFDPAQNKGWQFAVNANGAKFDGVLEQRVAGDPWKTNAAWNGRWRATAEKLAQSWVVRFHIPYATLNIDPTQTTKLRVNFTRESKASGENSSWNCYNGKFHDVNKYGELTLSADSFTLARARNTAKPTYTPKRTAVNHADWLQTGVPGHYRVDSWGHGYNRTDFPKTLQNRYSAADFAAWQRELLRAWCEAGMGGGMYPWAEKATIGGAAEIARLHSQYGMTLPYATFNSDHGRAGRKNGAVYIDARSDHHTSPVDPAYRAAVSAALTAAAARPEHAQVRATTSWVMGKDEPTNGINVCFSRTINHANLSALNALDAVIKRDYGFGRYGLPDFPEKATPTAALERIAFYRWWNAEFRQACIEHRATVAAAFPGTPFMAANDNNVAGQSMLDIANLDGIGEILSVDPYPTSTAAFFNFNRALWHVGFSVKVLHDLTPRSATLVMPQAFVYHGGAPSPEDLREWTSQALKTGATRFMWYAASAPWEIFPTYLAMLNITKTLTSMDKLKPPAEPVVGIWYSNFDKWAKNDEACHAAYSIYGLLGEQLKSDFRFVSDTRLAQDADALKNLKLIFVPRLSYIDTATASKLAAWVEAGGRLVVFDPDFMLTNINGQPEPTRQKLLNVAALPPKKVQGGALSWQQQALPLTATANLTPLPENAIDARTLPPPHDAKVIATYADGTPAGMVRPVGRGEVIFFAVQPFGNSDLGIDGGGWRQFFSAELKKVAAPTGSTRWDFMIPEIGNSVKLQETIK